MSTAASPARVIEAFHVGGVFSRFSRALDPGLLLPLFGRSAAGRSGPAPGSFRRRSRGAWCGACAWSEPWSYGA